MRAKIITLLTVASIIAAVLITLNIKDTSKKLRAYPYLTYTRQMYTARACDGFYKEFHRWPATIAELRSFRPDLNEWSTDMWGHDLILIPYDDTTGYGQIISLGSDGLLGGNTELAHDLNVHFPIESNANWNITVEQSLKKPELRL